MVAILFARHDSIYKTIQGCDVYDKTRNAMSYAGGMPIVAHPPCRSWGRLRGLAKPEPGEKELAIWAIQKIRREGGVLEHPESSQLWKELNLPFGLSVDEYGGFTLSVDQFWFGHRARKRTWLYVCGTTQAEIPPYPLRFELVTHTISTVKRKAIRRPEVSKAERERTPKAFAEFLIDIAKKCKK